MDYLSILFRKKKFQKLGAFHLEPVERARDLLVQDGASVYGICACSPRAQLYI